MMERICGVPVLGVVPVAEHIHIEEEDSVSLGKKGRDVVAGIFIMPPSLRILTRPT